MKTLKQALFATALAAISLPAFAQATIGTLTVNRGTVMTSTSDGQFVTASNGQALQAGQQITVGQDSAATVTYADGTTLSYTTPGTYTVSASAAAGAGAVGMGAAAGGASTVATAGIILGAAALAGVGVNEAGAGETVPPEQPVSR